MIVSAIAAAVSLAYLAAVPLRVAFVFRAENGMRFGAGISAFEKRFALRMAARRLDAPKKAKKRRLPSLDTLSNWLRAGKYLLRHVELDVRARLGFTDAALTALACGALGSLACAAGGATDGRVRAEISPDFSGTVFSGEISGIATLRAGHLMLAALIGAIDTAQGGIRHGQTSN